MRGCKETRRLLGRRNYSVALLVKFRGNPQSACLCPPANYDGLHQHKRKLFSAGDKQSKKESCLLIVMNIKFRDRLNKIEKKCKHFFGLMIIHCLARIQVWMFYIQLENNQILLFDLTFYGLSSVLIAKINVKFIIFSPWSRDRTSDSSWPLPMTPPPSR